MVEAPFLEILEEFIFLQKTISANSTVAHHWYL
jgi:hypothetical protein